MQANGDRGTLYVVSAPSGTGKSTLTRAVLAQTPGLAFSVSYTTRPRRPGEIDGREYHFVEDARFDSLVAAGDFLEWANVFGHRYGTSREATERALGGGIDLLLDIDVQGARQLRDRGVLAATVFILPPDFATLQSRLRYRGSEDEAQVARRLGMARAEAQEFEHYDYVVINDDLDRACREIQSIVLAERARVARKRRRIESIMNTFPPA